MTAHTAASETSSVLRRPPPTAVKILMPVWGYRYIRQFVEFCLPTLLTPGNIPALAEALPCEFHLMTSAADAPIIAEHPAWRKLQSLCRVKIELIDDLITDGNHSTTMTLACARAVRAVGAQMVDTCFIIGCGDYIFNNVALDSVLKRMNAGASAVLAGNFQVVAEDALPTLRGMIDPTTLEWSLSSRQLIRCGLTYLHPGAVGNIVNFRLFHNDHTNRLFWRVDDSTMIGRFYLMHAVCVRPEVTDFVIGSSFDYSFIPEMCPSNNVTVITDSDDYFVLELQSRQHEANLLRPGPVDAKLLAISLLEWTTASHRENVNTTVVFHAEGIPEKVAEVKAEADEFLGQVTALLTSPPQPHRNHPYWIGAIMAHRSATGQAPDREIAETDIGEDPVPPSGMLAFLWRLRLSLFGMFPELGICHPYWPDFHLPLQKLETLCGEGKRVLIASSTPNAYARWLAKRSPTSVTMESARLLNLSEPQYKGLFGAFDVCLVHLTERDLKLGDEFIDCVAPLLKPDGAFFLLMVNTDIENVAEFKQSFEYHSVRFGNLALWLTETRYIPTSERRVSAQKRIVELGQLARRRPLVSLPILALWGPWLLLENYRCNKAAAIGAMAPPERGYLSSILMEMRPSGRTEGGWQPRFVRRREQIRQPAPIDAGAEVSFKSSIADKLLLVAKSDEALPSLLARYKFAAIMLAGRQNVGQIGHDESIGPEIVRPAVKSITIYEFEQKLNASRPIAAESTINVTFHDIRRDQLPKAFDAIYTFDLLERVAPEDEDGVMTHVRRSLSHEGDIAIIGCPSYEADALGRLAAGRYRRGGSEFRSFMLRHFDVVLIFSMVKDEIQAGLISSADYFLAVGSGRHK